MPVTKSEILPAKVYRALLTQSGTSAPVAIVLENTLGTVNYVYVASGIYNITSAALFTVGKTFPRTDCNDNVVKTSLEIINTSSIYLSANPLDTVTISGTDYNLPQTAGFNNLLTSSRYAFVEILVYP